MNAAGIIACAAALIFAPLNQQANAQCPADVNHDHSVDGTDLTAILSTWGTNGGSAGGDINGDGTVSGLDLAFVLSGWGICPPTWATVLEWTPNPAVVTNTTMRAAITASGLPWRVRDNAANIEMLLVPAGTFTMGCSASTYMPCISDESPTHQVTLTQAFYMGRYEVTQAQWTAKMGSNPSWFVPAHSYSSDTTKPVESVSWDVIASGSTSFMSLTDLRLPTEAEWEYAYRAGTTTAFHNGSNDDYFLPSIAWFQPAAGSQTHTVGGKVANALGFHDMAGNVMEWCQDWYGSTYYGSSPLTNPTGPTTGSSHLLRGGSWGTVSGSCRASRRQYNPPGYAQNDYGFRVVRTADLTSAWITSITPTSGPTSGGTAITITGTNLTGATSVTVGGVAATNVVVQSATSVTAVTPAGTAGAKSVVVTMPGGTASLASAFTYVAPPWYIVLEQEPNAAVVTNVTMRNAITASGLPWRVQDNGTGIEMLLVPAGTFTMGESGFATPVHQVTLTNAFYMGKTEVTQAQWTAKMGSNPSSFSGYSDSPSRPVERVSWNMIYGFNNATGLRLPTEAEWEYAYRAGTTTAFHSYPAQPNGFNDDTLLGNIAWYSGNNGASGSSTYGTKAVGGKLANGLGLHDMAGNVWEWCQDWYGLYSSGSVTNPTGPTTGTKRLLRGGSWGANAFCRASHRTSFTPDGIFSYDFGFRVVRTPELEPTITSITPTSGSTAGGTPITITGTNLNGAISVTVGGVAATSVVVVSSTSVTAVTPAGTVGAKSVAVTNPSGTGSLANAFTYVVPTSWYIVLEQAPDASVVTNVTLRNAITASGMPWRVQDNWTGIEMLLVPGGTFTMGCSASTQYGCGSDESPTHQVTLTNAFYMGRYEVTQAQWTAKMGSNPSYFSGSDSPSRPVEQVSWNMIASGSTSFMSLTGLRLPTEAEWEYAYRAGTTTAFHSYPAQPNGFNDDTLLGNIAWFGSNAGDQTHAVGGKLANGLGLHDMAGNVHEWCQDWYGPYSSERVTNPTGPSTGSYRLLRDGSCYSYSDSCRASKREVSQAYWISKAYGFRVVRNP